MNTPFFRAVLGFALATTPLASIAAAYCSAGPHPDGMLLSDVRFDGNDSTDCYGLIAAAGTPSAETDAVNALTWPADPSGEDFTLLLKDDSIGSGSPETGIFDDLRFTLDVAGNSWLLTWTDLDTATTPNLPLAVDVVVLYKASNEMGIHFFDNLVLGDTGTPGDGAGSGDGTFIIRITNNRGVPQDISHLTLLVRNGSTSGGTTTSGTTTTGGSTTTGTTTGGGELSEPSSPLALIGLGLALLLLTRARSRTLEA